MLPLPFADIECFVWDGFPVLYRPGQPPEAWVHMHGHWGRISVESIAFECLWTEKEIFLARFPDLPALPTQAFQNRPSAAA